MHLSSWYSVLFFSISHIVFTNTQGIFTIMSSYFPLIVTSLWTSGHWKAIGWLSRCKKHNWQGCPLESFFKNLKKNYYFEFGFSLVWFCCILSFNLLLCLELFKKFSVVGGGGVESNFSVHLWSKRTRMFPYYFSVLLMWEQNLTTMTLHSMTIFRYT